MSFDPTFWFVLVLVISSTLIIEILLRLRKNRLANIAKLAKDQFTKEFSELTNFDVETNMTKEELNILANEYDEHVQRCVDYYGNWSDAIKSQDLMHMPDYQGKLLNVISGLRVTKNSPTLTNQRLYIFGGSTVFCGEVSDSLTLCSQLQDDIAEHSLATAVVNFGRHGSTFRNRILFLERCKLAKGDLILFWFGVNELGWKLLEGKTKGNLFIYLFRRVSEGLKYFSRYSELMTLLSQFFEAVVREPIFKLYAYLETRQSLRLLEKLSQLRGFEYKVILQPNLLTKPIKTHREDVMLDFFLSRDKGRIIKKLLDANYPRFRRLLHQFNGVDASGVFGETDREVFVDWVHLNSVGNGIVAKFIFDRFNNEGLFSRL